MFIIYILKKKQEKYVVPAVRPDTFYRHGPLPLPESR